MILVCYYFEFNKDILFGRGFFSAGFKKYSKSKIFKNATTSDYVYNF